MTTAQQEWRDRLERRFGDVCVGEWPAFRRVSRHYSPRLDIAVGPFATGDLRLGADYDELTNRHREYLLAIWDAHQTTLAQFDVLDGRRFEDATASNWNARCFLAIEIENEVSRKHLLGGSLNALALGRFGILVGWSPDKVRALVRAREYLRFLADVNKPSIAVDNLLVLDRAQAEALL